MKRKKVVLVIVEGPSDEEALGPVLNNYFDKDRVYVHTTVTAHDNIEYKSVQNDSFLTLPDGKPLSVIGIKKGFKEMGRVTGPDFLEEILKKTENTAFSHYFYGTTEKNLNTFVNKVKKNYPNLKIAGYEPSIFRTLTSKEEKELIDRINISKADFVWIALGAPRQEFFCKKLSNRTNSVWIAVGGAFNVISGVIPRAPQWMQNCGLEWFYRLCKEPKRMFKRYIVDDLKILSICRKY